MKRSVLVMQIVNLILLALVAAGYVFTALAPLQPVLFALLAVSVIVSAWGILVRTRRRMTATVKYLSSINQRLLAPLQRALSDLAIGDLTVHIRGSDVDTSEDERVEEDPFGVIVAMRETVRSLLRMHDDFSQLTATPMARLCYVGSNSYLEGRIAGAEVVRRVKGEGTIVAAVPSLRFANMALRVKGFRNALAEAHEPLSVEEVWEFHDSDEEAVELVRRYVASDRKLDVLYIADGNAPPTFVEELRRQRILDTTIVIAHDAMPETIALVRSGAIAATISQEPYHQGYNPVVHVYNRIVSGLSPDATRLLTNVRVIDGKTADGDLIETDSLPRLVDEPAASPPRILFIGMGDSRFWEPIARGVSDVRKEVEARGGVVDWVVPEGALVGGRDASVMVPVIDMAMRKKYDGLILPVSDEGTVLAINHASEIGIVVATYNTEPVSFRGLVVEVARHAEILKSVGDGVAASVEQSRQAIAAIHQTVERVSSKAREESEGITELTGELEQVSEDVAVSSKRAATSTETARDVQTQSEGGRVAVEETAGALSQFRAVSEETGRALIELADGISEITGILNMIQDMAEQTNVLAINAAIEASRAGESGAGFQIVSGEIRGFAEHSRGAVDRITAIIAGVRQRTERVQTATDQVRGQAENSLEQISHAQTALRTIFQNSSANAENLLAISESIASMQQEATHVTEQLARLSGEFHATTDAMAEIADSTKEMTQQSQALAEAAQTLRWSVHSIESIASQFVLE